MILLVLVELHFMCDAKFERERVIDSLRPRLPGQSHQRKTGQESYQSYRFDLAGCDHFGNSSFDMIRMTCGLTIAAVAMEAQYCVSQLRVGSGDACQVISSGKVAELSTMFPLARFFFAILKEGCGAGPIPVAEWYNRLSAAIQIRPLSRLNERRPIERMMQILAPQHSQLHLPEALATSLSTPERLVIWDHDIFSPLVRHRPETHDLALRACEDQRAPQALHTLTGLDLAQTGIAGRERHQFRPPQIQSRHFQRS